MGIRITYLHRNHNFFKIKTIRGATVCYTWVKRIMIIVPYHWASSKRQELGITSKTIFNIYTVYQ